VSDIVSAFRSSIDLGKFGSIYDKFNGRNVGPTNVTPFDNNSIIYMLYVDDYHVSPAIELSFSYVMHTACCYI